MRKSFLYTDVLWFEFPVKLGMYLVVNLIPISLVLYLKTFGATVVCILVWMKSFLRYVDISGNSQPIFFFFFFFPKILKKPSIVQKKMIPHMKAFSLFYKMKRKKKFQTKMAAYQKGHFPAQPILNIFLGKFSGLLLGFK